MYLWWSMGYFHMNNSGAGNAAAAGRPAEKDREKKYYIFIEGQDKPQIDVETEVWGGAGIN